jgi:hypothetical protein
MIISLRACWGRFSSEVPGADKKLEVFHLRVQVLSFFHFRVEIGSELLISGERFGVFSKQYVDTILREIFVPGIHKIPFNILKLVIDLSKDTLTAIFRHFGYSRGGTSILKTQIIALF